VFILGGGFAGVGAAQKLKDADAEVVLVDRHDYQEAAMLADELRLSRLRPRSRGQLLRHPRGGRARLSMTGKKAKLAWLTVHAALLPTNKDRAKALVDWEGAAMTHQRPGRITVEDM
jgi:NADH dehydrogenase FAD-containing subunit